MNQFTYRVEWSADVGEWIATCDQIHGLSALGGTPSEAVSDIVDRVAEIARRGQQWFWTKEWQAGEREVDEHIARGEVTTFASGEEFIEHLDEAVSEGTDADIHRTVLTDAAVDWVKSDSFVAGTSTIYLVALPVHLNPGYDVVPDLNRGYFLDPHEAAIEARKRLEFQVVNGPVEHRHNFAVSGAQVIPVSPNGFPSGLPLKPWSVRVARKGTDGDR